MLKLAFHFFICKLLRIFKGNQPKCLNYDFEDLMPFMIRHLIMKASSQVNNGSDNYYAIINSHAKYSPQNTYAL
jgi:hypothetical protein